MLLAQSPFTHGSPHAAASAVVHARRDSTLSRAAAACERVARVIDQRYAEPLTVAQLSDVAHLSEFHLHRVYLATTGVHVAEHLRLRRIERAMHLLVASNQGLDQVARAVGLGSAAALVHLFRREQGVTPGSFRRGERAVALEGWRPARGRRTRECLADATGAQLAQAPPRQLLTRVVYGAHHRGFSHVGFEAADRLLAAARALWPEGRHFPVYSVYLDRTLGPDDPTSRAVLGVELPPGCGGQALPPGLAVRELAGGLYLVLPSGGSHVHSWQRWSRVMRGDPCTPLALEPRTSAMPFETCAGFTPPGAARERLGVSIWLPVHARDSVLADKQAQQERDQDSLRDLRTGPGALFQRLLLQPS